MRGQFDITFVFAAMMTKPIEPQRSEEIVNSSNGMYDEISLYDLPDDTKTTPEIQHPSVGVNGDYGSLNQMTRLPMPLPTLNYEILKAPNNEFGNQKENNEQNLKCTASNQEETDEYTFKYDVYYDDRHDDGHATEINRNSSAIYLINIASNEEEIDEYTSSNIDIYTEDEQDVVADSVQSN